MRRYLSACALLLALALPARAQTPELYGFVTVTGTVTDASSGAPIGGAAVTFEHARRTVMTDDQGRFTLTKVDPGDERLTIEQLGYRDSQLGIEVTDGMPPVAVTLQPDPVLLKGLAVVAERLISRPGAFAMGVRTFDARDLQLASAFTVADFLRSRAAIVAVGCYAPFTTTCVWFRGGYEPIHVYVDDMEWYDGLNALASFPVSRLYRLEIYQRGAYIQLLTRDWARRAAAHGGRSDLPAFF